MVPKKLGRVGTPPDIGAPGELPVAVRSLGLAGEGFRARLVDRLIVVGLVGDQQAVAGRDESFHPPRRLRILPGQAPERVVDVCITIQTPGHGHQVVEPLGIRFALAGLKRLQDIIRPAVFLSLILGLADQNPSQVTIGAADLRDQSIEFTARPLVLAGADQLACAIQHRGWHQRRVRAAHRRLEPCQRRVRLARLVAGWVVAPHLLKDSRGGARVAGRLDRARQQQIAGRLRQPIRLFPEQPDSLRGVPAFEIRAREDHDAARGQR